MAPDLARIEAFLARLYADTEAQKRFLSDPGAAARAAGLSAAEAEALAAIDRTGFALACRSYAVKRTGAAQRPTGALQRWRGTLEGLARLVRR